MMQEWRKSRQEGPREPEGEHRHDGMEKDGIKHKAGETRHKDSQNYINKDTQRETQRAETQGKKQ